MLQKRELTGLAKIYWDAAQYLRAHAWCQGQVRKGDAVCIHGAFYNTIRRDRNREWLVAELKAFTEVFIRYAGITPACWNDMRGRTKKQVVAQLEAIAWKLADEQGG